MACLSQVGVPIYVGGLVGLLGSHTPAYDDERGSLLRSSLSTGGVSSKRVIMQARSNPKMEGGLPDVEGGLLPKTRRPPKTADSQKRSLDIKLLI